MTLLDITRTYNGSSGDATKLLYARLNEFGPPGVIAVNLLRAHKASARAKVYRGGYKGRAYEKKNWSMGLLVDALLAQGDAFVWGWKIDPNQEFHRWVLYVETPQGQASFHTEFRGKGPDYPGEWSGLHNSSEVIIKFAASLFNPIEPTICHKKPTSFITAQTTTESSAAKSPASSFHTQLSLDGITATPNR